MRLLYQVKEKASLVAHICWFLIRCFLGCIIFMPSVCNRLPSFLSFLFFFSDHKCSMTCLLVSKCKGIYTKPNNFPEEITVIYRVLYSLTFHHYHSFLPICESGKILEKSCRHQCLMDKTYRSKVRHPLNVPFSFPFLNDSYLL